MMPRPHSFFLLISLTTVLPAASPLNDSFAARTNLTGAAFPVAGTTVEATAEPGEPGPASGSSATRSIWWTWTAPATGWYDVRTTGSPVDTQLSVFRGISLTALTRLASNDDDPLSSSLTTSSRVRFEAVAGTAYQISVNGFEGAEGPCFLIVEPASLPANRVNTLSFSPSPADVTSQNRTVTVTFNLVSTTAFSYGWLDLYQFGGGLLENIVFSDADRTAGSALNGTYRLLVSIPRYMTPGLLPYTFTVATAASDSEPLFTSGSYGWQSLASVQPDGLSVTNTGTVDTSLPVLGTVTPAPASVDVTTTDVAVDVTTLISDTLTGFRSGTLSLILPVASGLEEVVTSVSFTAAERSAGTILSGTWTILLTIPQDAPSGTANLVFELIDAAGNRSTTTKGIIVITKNAYDAWALTNTLTGPDALPVADPDQDGLTNLTEFALNLDPLVMEIPQFRSGQPLQSLTQSGLGALPAVTVGDPGGVPVLTLGYLRRRAVSQPGLSYQTQFGPDPLQFATALSPTETTTPLSATWEWVQTQDPTPGSKRRFTRLRLEKP